MQPLGYTEEMNNNYGTIRSLLTSDIEKIIPISSLFLLFMIIGGNFLAPLFPCKLQRLLENNMYIKHILGLLTLIFFVELSNDALGKSLSQTFFSSLLLYIWFILTTTMEAKVFIILIILFAVMYTTNIYINKLDKEANPDSIRLTRFLRKIETMMYYLSIALTLFGVVAYYGRKKKELGTRFDEAKFFFGKSVCQGSGAKMTILDGFLYAIK